MVIIIMQKKSFRAFFGNALLKNYELPKHDSNKSWLQSAWFLFVSSLIYFIYGIPIEIIPEEAHIEYL